MQAVGKLIIWTVLVSSLLLAEGFATNAMACNYYASPNGGGNGSSPSSPFKISNFWSLAGPGKTLCLLDGVYSDSIMPPEYLNGTASARITIKALNDGKVRINGGGVRIPVQLRNNDYFLLEGFDAHNGSTGVIRLVTGADNNIVRRVCAWDVPIGGNYFVWLIWGNTGNLLEDVCGFGTGRKILEHFATTPSTTLTVRRMWGAWTRSTQTAPKMTFSMAYNSYNATYENLIGTWREEGSDSPGHQRNGIFGNDQMFMADPTANKCSNSKLLGSIAYRRSSDPLVLNYYGSLQSSNSVDCIRFEHVVAYEEGSSRTATLNKLDAGQGGPSAGKHIVNRVTNIGGAAPVISSDWTTTASIVVDTVGSAPNIWNGAGSTGARVCKRYVNGSLTSTPLWPWPMNQRIIDAMRAAGKTPVDVTRTMEEIFGPIPSECRGDTASSSSSTTTTSSVPTSPSNLSAQ